MKAKMQSEASAPGASLARNVSQREGRVAPNSRRPTASASTAINYQKKNVSWTSQQSSGNLTSRIAQAGAFDGETVNSAVADKSKLVYAGRLTLNFWDKEAGYYIDGTYYGDKDVLALGVAAQSQDSKTTASIDALMEKRLPNLGVVTIEAEYNRDNRLTSATSSDGWYGLAAYVFPVMIGVGRFQILGKYSRKTIDNRPVDDKLKTTEVNLNYLIESFSSRVGFYYLNQKNQNLGSSPNEFGLKLQLQM